MQLVRVLNAQRIPTPGSIIEEFNRELMQRTLSELREALRALPLPMSNDELQAAGARTIAASKYARSANAHDDDGPLSTAC